MKTALEYIRNIICFLCFFQVFLHLVPKEQYRKYLKLFGNLILMFLVLKPVTSWLGGEEELEHLLRQKTLAGEYEGLKLQMEGMEELKVKVVNQAFQEEIKRQIRAITEGYGLSVLNLEVEFEEERLPVKIGLKLLNDGKGNYGEKIGYIKEAIQDIYGILPEQITITMQG